MDASAFNEKPKLGICIGLNESSILFIHQKCQFSQAEKLSSFFQNLIIKGAIILSCFNDFEYNGIKFTAGKLPANSPSSFAVFLMIREVLPDVMQ